MLEKVFLTVSTVCYIDIQYLLLECTYTDCTNSMCA